MQSPDALETISTTNPLPSRSVNLRYGARVDLLERILDRCALRMRNALFPLRSVWQTETLCHRYDCFPGTRLDDHYLLRETRGICCRGPHESGNLIRKWFGRCVGCRTFC